MMIHDRGEWPDWTMMVSDVRQRWTANPEKSTVTDAFGNEKSLGILTNVQGLVSLPDSL